METIVNDGLIILAPLAALAFIIEYAWSHILEKIKPKTGSMGQPLHTTPPGYLRDQQQIDKEAPIKAKFNEEMQKFRQHQDCYEKAKPFVKRFRLYTMVATLIFGTARVLLWILK